MPKVVFEVVIQIKDDMKRLIAFFNQLKNKPLYDFFQQLKRRYIKSREHEHTNIFLKLGMYFYFQTKRHINGFQSMLILWILRVLSGR
jgi:hypothetical protein